MIDTSRAGRSRTKPNAATVEDTGQWSYFRVFAVAPLTQRLLATADS